MVGSSLLPWAEIKFSFLKVLLIRSEVCVPQALWEYVSPGTGGVSEVPETTRSRALAAPSAHSLPSLRVLNPWELYLPTCSVEPFISSEEDVGTRVLLGRHLPIRAPGWTTDSPMWLTAPFSEPGPPKRQQTLGPVSDLVGGFSESPRTVMSVVLLQ